MMHTSRGVHRHQDMLRMHALLQLSGKNKVEADTVLKIVKEAPDFATASYVIRNMLGVQSETLEEKWNKHIAQAWFALHPGVPSSLKIHIMSNDVECADALMEVHGVLQYFLEKNVPANDSFALSMLPPKEETRIAQHLLMFQGDAMQVRRVCAVLEELRLIRVVKGNVKVVKGRYGRFEALPLSAQYYLLWHVDMYHLDWKEYADIRIQPYIAMLQHYLPMIWEMLEHTVSGQTHMVDEFAWHVVRAFRPLWQQERAFGLYEQTELQQMVVSWLVTKVFERYALIEFGIRNADGLAPQSFEWTRLGGVLLESERTVKLPCATDVLE